MQLSRYISGTLGALCLLLGNSQALAADGYNLATHPHYTTYKLTCPEPSTLTKSPGDSKWYKKPYWHSYQMSLSNALGGFIGAQWSGTNIGQIICVYNSEDKTDFPVQVYFSSIVQVPSGGAWSKDKGGYRDCPSDKISDCSFNAIIKKKKQTDYYKDALKLRP